MDISAAAKLKHGSPVWYGIPTLDRKWKADGNPEQCWKS